MSGLASKLWRGVDVVGRLMAVAPFFGSATDHILQWKATADLIAQCGIPVSVVLVAIVIAAELGAEAAFLVGWRPHIAAMALAAFTLVAAAMFHLHPQEEVEMHLDFRDLALFGALLCFTARPWPRAEARRSRAATSS
jgi:putative oxidoreductase